MRAHSHRIQSIPGVGDMGKRPASKAKPMQREMDADVTCPFCLRHGTQSKRGRKVQSRQSAVFTCPFCARARDESVIHNRSKKPKLGEAETSASGSQEPCVSSPRPYDEIKENESRRVKESLRRASLEGASGDQEPCVSLPGQSDEIKENEFRLLPDSLYRMRGRVPPVNDRSNQEPRVSSARPPDEISKENESRQILPSLRRHPRKGTPRRASVA